MKKLLLSVVFTMLSFFTINPAFAETNASKEIACLAKAIYFESKGGSPSDMKDVGHVVLNRVNNPKFPSSICSVVYQRSQHVCQFSWACKPHRIKEVEEYSKAKAYAKELIDKENTQARLDTTRGALFFRVTRNVSKACHINNQHAFFRSYR